MSIVLPSHIVTPNTYLNYRLFYIKNKRVNSSIEVGSNLVPLCLYKLSNTSSKTRYGSLDALINYCAKFLLFIDKFLAIITFWQTFL